MIVAEVQMLTMPSSSFLSSVHGQHNVHFDCLETAEAEYRRVAELLERKERKANDLPVMLEVVGSGNRVSFPLADLRAVALADYDHSNRQRSGIKEAFPNLF